MRSSSRLHGLLDFIALASSWVGFGVMAAAADTIAEAAASGPSLVRPELAERLELQGWERAFTYELFLTTGMRKGELASITVGDVDLSDDAPAVTLRGVRAKNGKRSTIPLRG